MEGRVICAFSYWLLERQRRRERVKEAEEGGGRQVEDERWMVDTKRS